jgi:hypothetical protein
MELEGDIKRILRSDLWQLNVIYLKTAKNALYVHGIIQ